MRAKRCRGCSESLAQAKAGDFARVHTPEQIVARRRGRPIGSKQEITKEAVKIRLDADVNGGASGERGWLAKRGSTMLCGHRWPSAEKSYPHDCTCGVT